MVLPTPSAVLAKASLEPRPQAMSTATTAHLPSLRSWSQGLMVSASISLWVFTRKTRGWQESPVSLSLLLMVEM